MVTPMEYQEAIRIAHEEGLHRLDPRRPWASYRLEMEHANASEGEEWREN